MGSTRKATQPVQDIPSLRVRCNSITYSSRRRGRFGAVSPWRISTRYGTRVGSWEGFGEVKMVQNLASFQPIGYGDDGRKAWNRVERAGSLGPLFAHYVTVPGK